MFVKRFKSVLRKNAKAEKIEANKSKRKSGKKQKKRKVKGEVFRPAFKDRNIAYYFNTEVSKLTFTISPPEPQRQTRK